MKILIADDHPIVREGLKNIITAMPGICQVDQAGEGFEALKKIKSGDYDLLILDISLPGINGLDILSKLQANDRNPAILILSFHPQEHYAIRAFRMGASGYVVKNSSPGIIGEAIEKVAGGGQYVSPELAEKMIFPLSGDTLTLPHEKLSRREFHVMTKLAAGDSVTDIAASLFISAKTVSTYRTRILNKMNMQTNSELTRYALLNGLIE